MRKRFKPAPIGSLLFVCVGLLTFGASFVPAQGGAGIRAGASVDPDQFYFGGHLELGPVVEQLWFRPNVEVGLGNDRTLVGINAEMAYRFPLARTDWDFYAGAGPALNIINRDNDRFRRNDTETGGGFNMLLGVAHRDGFFGELKVGVIDSPEFKLGIGYTFR